MFSTPSNFCSSWYLCQSPRCYLQPNVFLQVTQASVRPSAPFIYLVASLLLSLYVTPACTGGAAIPASFPAAQARQLSCVHLGLSCAHVSGPAGALWISQTCVTCYVFYFITSRTGALPTFQAEHARPLPLHQVNGFPYL